MKMEIYIIRIYQRRDNNLEAIVGMSEHVETGEKKGFRSLTQLNRILLRTDSGNAHANEDDAHTGNSTAHGSVTGHPQCFRPQGQRR